MALEGATLVAAPVTETVPADDAKRLIELQREMARCADMVAVRTVLAEGLAALLPVRDRVSLVFLEPDGEWMRIYKVLPVAEPTATLPRVRVEGTPVGQVVREGVGRVVADVRTDPNITFGHASHDGIRSTVSVPLKIGGKVIGAMNAGSRTIGACTEDMLRRLEDIAAVVGPAFYAAEQARAVPLREEDSAPVTPRARSIEMVGSSPAFRTMVTAARRTAKSDADVLITGETGVGKTALARAMHGWSSRRAAPFVTVHLADLSPTLVESELFGYERGAFTGASASRVGRFESARGGTIFLDEIGETPLHIQAKLLRVVQDRCFERVGGGRTLDVDVRIIAATSRDLREAIRRGEFREDLYFRLSVVPLHLPPLRERAEDLELLVGSILARIQASDQRPRSLAPPAWDKVRAYSWPGNIRELESVLRRAAILEETDELALEGLATHAQELAPIKPPTRVTDHEPLLTLDEHERAYIERVLHLRGEVIEGAHGAARVLGVPPSTLRSKMKKLGISLTRGKGRNV